MKTIRKHRALILWAKSKDLTLPIPYESLIAIRRRETAQARRVNPSQPKV